jgi:hypothetical protein
MRRYDRTSTFGIKFSYGTSYAIPIIRDGIANGTIRYKESILKENDRLDIIAGKEYGDSTLYWIISAASSIGWGLQCPAGTSLKIPNISDVSKYLS